VVDGDWTLSCPHPFGRADPGVPRVPVASAGSAIPSWFIERFLALWKN